MHQRIFQFRIRMSLLNGCRFAFPQRFDCPAAGNAGRSHHKQQRFIIAKPKRELFNQLVLGSVLLNVKLNHQRSPTKPIRGQFVQILADAPHE